MLINNIKENFRRVFYQHRKAAEGSSISAMNKLAVHYYNEKGTEKDLERAFHWYQKAAESGNVSAMNGLASCYYSGEWRRTWGGPFTGIRKRQRVAIAMNGLASCYYSGKGTKRDLERAFHWYQKAAEGGNKAADGGNINAINSLAGYYYSRKGMEKDLKRTFYWLQKAAEGGNVNAMYRLADYYYNGKEMKKDLERAFYWYQKVAESGNVNAMYNLAIYYYNTEKTERNLNISEISEFETSGNKIIDQFISKNNLKWIPYNKFENIKYFDKGGFSTLYRATYKNIEIVLKHFNYFNDSDENLKKILNEWKIIKYPYEIINVFGFTKNPNTLDYILIMEYANKGNLRKFLTEIASNWGQKLYMLYKIIEGLNNIHKENLIHYDFHDGNILCIKYKDTLYGVYISDYLGSYQSAKSFLKKDNIYGVVPFIAPEILKGEVYTQASDIYSFSMIMWEFTSGITPFSDKAHDLQLALSICKGERPEIIENIPQCYTDLMKKCWDEDPLKRPSASEVLGIIEKWVKIPHEKKIENISKELKSNIMELINAPIRCSNLITKYHPQAYYTSRLLDFTSEEVNKILKESQELKFFEKKEDANHEFFELEKIAKIYYQHSQNELKEKQLELVALQQKNSQFEQDIQKLRLQIKESAEKEKTLRAEKLTLTNNLVQQLEQNKLYNQQVQDQINQLNQELVDLQQKFEYNNQNLKLDLAVQIKKSAEKEDTLQTQIIYLQNEIYVKQFLGSNLAEQLEQNTLTNQRIQDQVNQLKQEKFNLQEKLTKIETNIQELKSQQESLIEQKEQLEIKLGQIQDNYERIKQEKIELRNMIGGLSADQKLNAELKAKLEKEINKLEQELNYEKQIKEQLIQASQIKEDKINELEQKLINLDNDRIDTLKDKRNELKKLNKGYDSLTNIIRENKELEVTFKINDILKLDSFNIDRYNIFNFAINSQEGTRTKLNSRMMEKDINSLKRNLDELKAELKQERKELKNLE
ncbi:hypothetical protein RclHR1_07260006 [Rhizophagus clarus]|uniref:Protein kinase domain-containing protein n=1 Tax=Rhizophagus clarus TaxID=94130 RepID=A0A2Z6S839_9GLOM|nr:hypothetical protein RclHR1_07260006 [Rhizophagus clarus]